MVMVLFCQAAHADSVDDRLHRARETRHQAEAAVHALQARLATLQGRLTASQRALDRATTDTVAADQQLRNASIRLDLARDTLAGRVRAAYEYSPASALSIYLSAQNPSDLASVNEFTSRVISRDMDAVDKVQNAENDLAARKADLAARRANLGRQRAEVHSILVRMQSKLSRAREEARRANLTVSSLSREQAAIDAAKKREADRQRRLGDQSNSDSQLVTGGDPGTVPDPPAFNQAHLLSLLGPTEGRTCAIPPGLRDTGQRIAGKATWYGPGFVGKRTASGAIFDPRLFTAAHRTLPFGTFLRVHHGGRCAIVLVNDRGPWIYDRIIDLSEAAGQYLGVSLTHVNADILVPA